MASHGTGSLESVLITAELARRPPRPPDYEAENRALILLAQELANSPRNVLQKLVEVAMDLCKAHSAGVSLLESDDEKEIFRWNAVTGKFAVNLGGGIARDLSPCGVVLDRNSVLLFGYPERHYNYPVRIDPPIVEALLTPFHLGDKPVGTVWVIAHDENRKFDAEDARILQSLGKFASSAFQALRSLDALKVEIDEREQAERQLRASEERLRALVSASSEVVYRMSPDWTEMRQLGGREFLAETKAPSQHWLQEYIPLDDQPEVWAAIQKAIREKSLFALEHRVRRADGSLGWTLSRAVPLLNEKGEIREWFGAASDVTGRKHAEEALQESESRFRLFMDNSPAITWVKDEQGRYVYLSRTFENRFEVRLEDWRGKTDLELWPAEMARRFRENDLAVLASNRPMEVIEESTHPGGGKVVWLNSKFPIVSSTTGQRFVAGIGVDITERRRSERALIRSEKLASVGRMAATVAHEINNPLAAAVNALYLATMAPDLPDSVRANLELADQELRQIAHITKQTLGFYHEVGAPTAVRLPEIIDGTVDMYAAKLRNKSIRVERRYRGPGRVCGSEGELRQIAANLVGNSIDALRSSGVLHIRMTPWNADRPMVRLTMADTGSGISPENLKQIFEPFFTTKESFGTGLGLWVTKELVKKHEGNIRVRSRIGKGTVFSIWLPTERRRSERDDTAAA